jgi:hypothetical protein
MSRSITKLESHTLIQDIESGLMSYIIRQNHTREDYLLEFQSLLKKASYARITRLVIDRKVLAPSSQIEGNEIEIIRLNSEILTVIKRIAIVVTDERKSNRIYPIECGHKRGTQLIVGYFSSFIAALDWADR